ncbi:hypothetical protein [Nocardioides sp. J54]|uniref:hypothetical protein n=1 Tax=Nocardioides sp. J54 TaxID=935866 RepID=UPI0012FC579C|nr:hypothetical protein [Nocardioides sp. J54]
MEVDAHLRSHRPDRQVGVGVGVDEECEGGELALGLADVGQGVFELPGDGVQRRVGGEDGGGVVADGEGGDAVAVDAGHAHEAVLLGCFLAGAGELGGCGGDPGLDEGLEPCPGQPAVG